MFGFQYRQTRNYDNFQIGHFKGEGFYEMPVLYPGELPAPDTEWISFNFVRGDKEPEKHAVHFFIDDYQFERIWDSPYTYLEKLSKYRAVCTPDFSGYSDMPRAQQIWNQFRGMWMGAFWQYYGLNVIQTVGWSDLPEDDDWCFDGCAKRAPVAVSAIGTQNSKEKRDLFMRGYREMARRLEPSAIVFYGEVPKDCENESSIIMQIPAFQNKWLGHI